MTNHGIAGKFYWHTLDMSAFCQDAELTLTRDLFEHRAWGEEGVQRLGGLRTAQIALTGTALTEGTIGLAAWAKFDSDTVPRIWTYAPKNDTFGYPVYCAWAEHQHQQRVAGSDVVRLPVGILSTRYLRRCISLRALASGGTSPGSTHTAAAGTTDGGVGFLHVTALTGTLNVIIQHSANGTDWATLLSFTQQTTGAPSSQAVPVTGTVNKYLRVSWTLPAGAATWFAAFGRY